LSEYALEDYFGKDWGHTVKLRLGSILKTHRVDKQMTQKEVASVLEVGNDSVVRRWELGYSFPKFAMLEKLASVYNVNVHDDFLAPAVAGLYRANEIGTLTTKEREWLELFRNLNATNQSQILNAGQILLLSESG